MFVNEDEAKKMVCTAALRIKSDGYVAAAPCLGSECMAWRWEIMGAPVNEKGDRADIRTKRGYCGLAGEPPRYDLTLDELEAAGQED